MRWGVFLISVCSGLCWPVEGHAQSIPTGGAYGIPSENGCRAYRGETEGAYLVFEKRGVGTGGEGGCDFTKVEKISPREFLVKQVCTSIEGETLSRGKTTIVVPNNREVIYGGTRYVKC